MRFIATIKWLDNGNIQDNMILKIGDIEEDDDDIFFYLDSERELEEFKKEGVHDWVIIDVVRDKYISETREDVGKYNTVKKVIEALGRRPSEQELASFITNNYYDITEVERGQDDPQANDKIADLVAFYKFDIEEWLIAWHDAQNELM